MKRRSYYVQNIPVCSQFLTYSTEQGREEYQTTVKAGIVKQAWRGNSGNRIEGRPWNYKSANLEKLNVTVIIRIL